MNGRPAIVRAPHYVLGESAADHGTIVNLGARTREFRMQPDAELWGWGTIHRTAKSLEAMAIDSGSASLQAAAMDPARIDGLILCSTRFPGGAETHGRFVETIANGLGLGSPAFLGLTLNRCTNLLAALQVADALVAAGRHRHILVITTDRITDEAARMENFALFSDGAASCVVTADAESAGGYDIVSCASAQNTRELDWAHQIRAELSRQVNERLLGPLGMKLDEVDGLLHANLFTPLVVTKERQAGFTPAQLYTENIARVGHCFAADPLINLVDREGAGHLKDGGYYLLAASVPGSRIGVLVRRRGAVPSSDEPAVAK